ncbi:MAG: TonB-dependent siderophore receptor [Epsilonproteobacteria bacterium]|nr:TonB-dependent siderophore receptor [Campylobacterota bacterium]
MNTPKRHFMMSIVALAALPYCAIAADVVNIGTIDVEGSQLSGHSPLNGYIPKLSATATKTDTDILETPQSISIVGQQQIQIIGAESIMESLSYTPGISIGNNDADIWESFYIRGFKSRRIRRDGMTYQVDAWDGQTESYGIERVEVLKGPSSTIYGGDEPGGTVNMVSKRPAGQTHHEIKTELGSEKHKLFAFDLGDKIDNQGRYSYRFIGLIKDGQGFSDNTEYQRLYIAPSFLWQLSENTLITFLSEFQRDNATPLEYGLPKEGTVVSNPNGTIPQTASIVEPGFDNSEVERYSLGYILEHQFSESLKLHHQLRYFHASNDLQYMKFGDFKEDMRTLERNSASKWYRTSKQITIDNYLQSELNFSGITHKILTGFDYSFDELTSERYDISVTNGDIDIYTPRYGQATFSDPEYNSGSRYEKTEQMGIYLQDQFKIDKLSLTFGGRYGKAEWGEKPFDGSKSYELEDDSAFTGKAGAVYLTNIGLAPFVSYTQSFKPQGGSDRLGNRFDPTEGEQYELGIRYRNKAENALISMTLYDLTKTNVRTPDPINPEFSVQTGEITSTGIELEIQAKINETLNIFGGYTYTDARTTKSNNPEEVDQATKNIPKKQFSLWGDYNFQNFGLPNLKMGAGIRHTGEIDNGSYEIDSHSVVDTMISYQGKKYSLQLNASNLFDKEYAEGTYNYFYGEPRKIKATLTYQW